MIQTIPDDSDVDANLVPPSAERVAARAVAMSVVTCRAFIENEGDPMASFWTDTRAWFDTLDLDSELEPWEREVIDTPLGQLSRHLQANGQWLCEGLVVLAWALERHAMPAHDETIVAAQVGDSLGFRMPRSETTLAAPALRAPGEIERFADLAFAVHWRLREFSLSPRQMDFRTFGQTAWFGPLAINDGMLCDDDLRTGTAPIAAASDDERQLCMQIAVERHRAANWLLGYDEVYSETDTST